MIAFPPVVEPEHPDAFITMHPRKLLEQNGDLYYWGSQIPLMTGVTKDEGALKSACKNFTYTFSFNVYYNIYL